MLLFNVYRQIDPMVVVICCYASWQYKPRTGRMYHFDADSCNSISVPISPLKQKSGTDENVSAGVSNSVIAEKFIHTDCDTNKKFITKNPEVVADVHAQILYMVIVICQMKSVLAELSLMICFSPKTVSMDLLLVICPLKYMLMILSLVIFQSLKNVLMYYQSKKNV